MKTVLTMLSLASLLLAGCTTPIEGSHCEDVCMAGTVCGPDGYYCIKVKDAGADPEDHGTCTPSTCPTGCCKGSECITTAGTSACGTKAETCLACNPVNADTCANGACQCGTSRACADGQRCSGGKCICDASVCSTG